MRSIVRKMKYFFMKDDILRDKNETSFGMIELIAFMVCVIAKEDTRFGPKGEFVRIVRFEIWKTSTSKYLEKFIIRNLRKKFSRGEIFLSNGVGSLFIK